MLQFSFIPFRLTINRLIFQIIKTQTNKQNNNNKFVLIFSYYVTIKQVKLQINYFNLLFHKRLQS